MATAAPGPAGADSCPAGDSVCQQLQDARQTQADTDRHLQEIQGSIADVQQRANATMVYIRQLDAQVEQQRAAVAQTQAQLDETDRRIRLTEAEIERRGAHLTVREQLLAQRVRVMDQHGTLQYLEILVTARSFTDLVDRVMLAQDVIRSDRQLVGTLREERDRIGELRQRLGDERAQEAD